MDEIVKNSQIQGVEYMLSYEHSTINF